MVGVPPQAALATGVSVMKAIALAGAGVEATEATMVTTTAATLEVAVVLVVMAVIPEAATLEAPTPEVATLEAVIRRGSRNTTLEMTKRHGGPRFLPTTPAHRTTRPSHPYPKPPLPPQRHQQNLRPKRSTCLALMMMVLAAGLQYPLR